LVDFLGEDSVMSTTVLEARGPNKALFRTAALAGSAIIWGTLGYLALTYVPKYEKPAEADGPIIDTFTPPKPIDPPVPPVTKPDKPKPEPTILSPSLDASPTPPKVYQPTTSAPNPLPSEYSSSTTPSAPTAAGTGSPEPIAVPMPVDPPIILALPIPDPVPIPASSPTPQVVSNPVKLSGVNPAFPGRALDAGISGEVSLAFTVLPNGKVDGIRVIRENPTRYGFARAAEAAIATWTFQPQTIDGIPVAYPARYTISFKLED
jgi:periplasmic protein TonB